MNRQPYLQGQFNLNQYLDKENYDRYRQLAVKNEKRYK